MFRITAEPILPLAIDDRSAGGFVTFEGKVRNRNDGRTVERLEYEAHIPLAEAEGQRILDEAIRAFDLVNAAAVHRIGTLEIGETAVWIGVAAKHRDAAFRACTFVIDELKKRLPIWKKEHYADGDSGWIGVEAAPQLDLYSRQIALSEVGREGQERLATARILVVGAGGLGCALLPYLAAAGVGEIGISEGDVVDLSNLHRQVLYGFGDHGQRKGVLAASSIRRLNPRLSVQVHDRIDLTNAADIISTYDLVVDGTDNFATKLLLNDVCWRLAKPLVLASLFKFEGQLLVIEPGSNGGCLRCMWPEPPYDGCVGTCAEEGILGSVAGALGTMQATEALKLILGIGETLGGAMLTLDLRTWEMRRIVRTRRPECPTCGSGNAIQQVDLDWDSALERQLAIVDVREPEEWTPVPVRIERIPLSQIGRLRQRALEGPVLLVCDRGVRSASAARALQAEGIDAFSLAGGIRAVRE